MSMASHIDTTQMITIFREAEQEISAERGEFTLFGLFERLDIYGKYDGVVSAPWLKEDGDSIRLIFSLVRAAIGHDKWISKIGGIFVVSEHGPFAAAVREALPNGPIQHGRTRITNFFYDGEIIRDAVIITSVEPAAETLKPKRKQRAAEPVAA